MSFLGVEQVKGDPDHLDGRLVVYAKIDADIPDLLLQGSAHSVYSMVHNGMLAVQGNYRDVTGIKEFLEKELGVDLEGNLDDFIEHLDGIEGALDPQKLREKLDNLEELKDFIPTPARTVPFGSERDIMQEEGDIFFAGTFRGVANANLGINSVPILYQAKFREQEASNLLLEIESLISQVETIPSRHIGRRFDDPGTDVASVLMKEMIPRMLYAHDSPHDLDPAVADFRSFLEGYPTVSDIDIVEGIVRQAKQPTADQYKLLELHARRIAAVAREDMKVAAELAREIAELEKQLGV